MGNAYDEKNKHYNIMTSCDENLINYVSVQLFAMSRNLNDSAIDFYLFHRNNLKLNNLNILEALCRKLKNISFHSVVVPEAEKYDTLASCGGGWAGEAYFPLCAHQLLPDSVDRILYIDAGDVIINDDIFPYYNCDFEDKALIVTAGRYKQKNNEIVPYEETDLYDNNGFLGICRGLFNSGSYIINIDKLRKAQLDIDDYISFMQLLRKLSGKDSEANIYWGDQGFLSAAFVGDIKLYEYPEVKDLWYMPYNFCLWYYDRKNTMPQYKVSIIHYAGPLKPWTFKYHINIKRFSPQNGLHLFDELKIGQAEWFYVWHEYAILTDRLLMKMGY